MKIQIDYERADFNKSLFGNEKLLLVVKFPDAIHAPTGKPFKWIPSYEEIKAIQDGLKKIEVISWNGVNYD